MDVQSLNGLPGLETRESVERTTALSGFFMRIVRARLSMVGRMGEPQGSPGFSTDRFSSLVRFTTRILENAMVSPLNISRGFAS